MLDALTDGRRDGQLAPLLRGLAYADGVFETLRRSAGQVPFWPWHRARLRFALAATGLAQPDWPTLEAELQAIAAAHPDAVIKLILVAPAGGRGYGRPWPAAPVRHLQAFVPPPTATSLHAVSALHAQAAGPSPRGLKRLAMVDQVRAQSAAEAAGADTALLRDRAGRPLSFSQGSLLVRRGSDWLTPPVADGALAGVCRAWLLCQPGVSVRVERLGPAALRDADEVVFANAVRGPLALASLDGQCLSRGSGAAELALRWCEAAASMASGGEAGA